MPRGPDYSDKVKLEVVQTYLLLGNSYMVEAVTGVASGTVRQWKLQPWWKELVEQIHSEEEIRLSGKLQTRVDKVLELVEDRLENGDYMYSPTTGALVRKPVSLKDGWRVGAEMLKARNDILTKPKEQVNQEAVADILKALAKDFAQMAKRKMELVNVQTKLSTGVPELPVQTGPDQKETDAESSPSNLGESGTSS